MLVLMLSHMRRRLEKQRIVEKELLVLLEKELSDDQ